MRECGSGFRAGLRLLAVLAVSCLPLGGCGTACAEEVIQHEPSPYGRGAAIVFVRDCGDAGIETQVAIVGHVDAAPQSRNVVFTADTDHGAAPSGPAGGPAVRVRWIDGSHVEIAHHPRARVLRGDAEHGYLRITYAALR